jgi:nicotinamide-nucleotide amidase
MMNAEILCVGTEILLGDIVNTNAAYIAKELAALGIGCYSQSVVGDNPRRLMECLRSGFERADIIIMTGGLGPTYDDLTKETVAEYFGLPMELNRPALNAITCFFGKIGREMTPNNEKQAMMPKGAFIFPNDRGTAPGLAVEQNGKTAILLPGPPREMTAMFEKQARPFLQGRSGKCFVSRAVHLFGIGESSAENMLPARLKDMENPTVAPYAKEGEVRLRVTASAASGAEAEGLLAPVVDEICGIFERYVYGVDVGSLQNALVMELTKRGKTLAVAESCTGGLIASRVTEIPGASKIFGYGVCTYANEAKTKLLGVKPGTLEKFGAVSKETALEMARGARAVSGADIAVSVTGIAGPDGGTPEKPVGLVWVGVCDSKGEAAHELRLSRGYAGDRGIIRNMAAMNAMHYALRAIQQHETE